MPAKLYAASSVLPIVILIISGVFLPKGTDPRGFGPPLIGGLVAFATSVLLGIVGIVLLAAYRKSPEYRRWFIIGTVVSLLPFGVLVVEVLRGHA